jgi:hypothetical protein
MPLYRLMLLALCLFTLPVAAQAETGCEADLAAVADAIGKKTDLSDTDRQELQDMQAQAGALCDSGNAEEGKSILAEAKALLGIDK